MNLIIPALLIIPLILPAPKNVVAPSTKCNSLIEVIPTSSSSDNQKFLVKKSGTTPDHIFTCIGRRDLKGSFLLAESPKIKFKKDQVVKVPKSLFHAFSPLGIELHYYSMSLDSFGPTSSQALTGKSLLLRYSKTLKKKYDAIFWLGLNQTTAEGNSNTGEYRNVSSAAPIGQFRLKYNHDSTWSFYTFLRLERFSVLGLDSQGRILQTFTYKTDSGLGLEKWWRDNWISRLDASVIYPSKNDNNSLQSGVEVGLELEYLWRKWMLSYRYAYLDINKEVGNETGSTQVMKLGYRF
jgi:hypothetical protein